MAERSGFEPENRFKPVTHLAGGRFRPLSHLSAPDDIISRFAPDIGILDIGTLIPLKSLSALGRLYIGLVVFSLCGSLLSECTHLSPGPIAPIASILTILAGFMTIFEPEWREPAPRSISLLFSAFAIGCAAELLGIFTGIPFGRYEYSRKWEPVVNLGEKIFPLLLPFAWLMVVGACMSVCMKLRHPVICGALLATAIDFVMEPVMTGPLDYWRWVVKGPLPGGASLLNPIGWFITSWLVGLVVVRLKVSSRFAAGTILAGHVTLTLGIAAIAVIPR